MCDTFSACISEQKHCVIVIRNTVCDNFRHYLVRSEDIQTGSGYE